MIRVENIKKKFGDNNVLRDVSLSVEKKTIYGLIGKNGAGKTTLLTIMANLATPDSGICELMGKRVSYLPDIPEFYDYMNCGEYIDFLLADYTGNLSKKRNELLELVSLDKGIRIKTMSRGMRQRLGLASVLVNNPDVLLLDEPTSALDPAGRIELMEILKRLRDEGKSIIMSTHILADMEKICDAVGFLQDGVIKKTLKVSELNNRKSILVQFAEPFSGKSSNTFGIEKKEDNIIAFYLNEDNSRESQRIFFEYLSLLNNEIISIKNESLDLEDIFKEVCGS